MLITQYEVIFRTRITKLLKRAIVIAKSKKEAKDYVFYQEGRPIIKRVSELETLEIPDNYLVPCIQKREFAKGDTKC